MSVTFIKSILLPACCLLLVLSAAHGDGRQLYKWVDENGVVHYGDSVPPQYAKQERRVLNEHGVEVGRLEAEKSEAQRRADEDSQRAVASARQRDQILLNTYVSVEQIEQLRDQRLDLVSGQMKVTEQYIGTLQQRLSGLQGRAQFFRPYNSGEGAKPMPGQLAEDLVRTVNEIRVQEHNLAAKRAEQQELRTHFQADIERFRELRGK